MSDITRSDIKKLLAERGAEISYALVKDPGISPEFLYYFSTNKDPNIRREVAKNPKTPLLADLIMAKDSDDNIRLEIAKKIAHHAAELSENDEIQLTGKIVEIIEVLASDNLPKIREAVSESIKQSSSVPQDIVLKLAKDIEGMVSGPILEFSPVLTESNLIELIADGLTTLGLMHVARRANLTEVLSDAISSTKDEQAVVVLLENKTALISENTYHAITEMAQTAEVMHKPFSERTDIPVSIMHKIAGFLSIALIEQALGNNPQSAEVEKQLLEVISSRPDFHDADEAARKKAIKMHVTRQITDASIRDAIKRNDVALVVHAMSQKTGIDVKKIRDMLQSDDPKAVVALCWKARLNMDTAVIMQSKLAGIAPSEIMHNEDDDKFPLNSKEIVEYLVKK